MLKKREERGNEIRIFDAHFHIIGLSFLIIEN
ncbi:unnamed protein product [Bacillus thuringiensis DB27]|uniref:Uncharacterized protein n=1 Tax=Bacillus thuringiensis DB27 TaxID=1431339 RepID=W8Y259_BACTU|nr:unnamed protein product [Bacillus thuringiensis DB27]